MMKNFLKIDNDKSLIWWKGTKNSIGQWKQKRGER